MGNEVIPAPPAMPLTVEEREMVANADTAAFAIRCITTDADALDARALLSDVHGFQTQLEERRTEYKAPYLAAGRAVDAVFKPALDTLERAKSAIKSRLTSWAVTVDAQRKAAEDEAERIASAEGRDVAPITHEVVKLQASARVLKTREFKEVLVTDEAALPREYLMPNMAKIKDAALGGVLIPGVSIKIEKRAVT